MQQTIEHADRHAAARRPAEPDARHWLTALAPYRELSALAARASWSSTRAPDDDDD